MQDRDPWGDCPAGVVSEMAGRLRRRKRQTQLRSLAASGLAMLLVAAIGYGLVTQMTGEDPAEIRAGLNCRETIRLLASYQDQSLEDSVAKEVREHLSRCPSCRKHYEEKYPSEVRNRSSAESRQVALAVP
jgi:hypothetical protein